MRKKVIWILAYCVFAGNMARALSQEEILRGADGRIETIRKGDAILTLLDAEGRPLPANVEVQIEQTRHKFLFGSNIFKLNRCRSAEDEKAYRRRFADLLNFATLPFYWWNYTPRPNEPDDARTEGIIAFCKEHGITTKGHPLAWNWADPPWLPDDPAKVMELQMSRIDRCVRRFDGSIDIWDVVNEATHYDRPEPRQRAPKLTRAIEQMGITDYVRQAFRTARQANPDALLVINDYRTDPEFAEKVISELVDKDGKPMYDVIGIQSHMHGGYWDAKKTWEVCEYFTQFNRPLHFTEVTVVSGPRTETGWKTTPEGEAQQARQVAEFYTILFSHPAVEAITWWDFSDQNAWQGAPAGFLRDDMSPKPVYEELYKRIKGQWWTKTTVRTNSDGQIKFRGFLGDYNIVINDGEGNMQTTFSLDRRSGTIGEVRLN
ncbi:MAG: endo-1,4-beta-xylanase [Sedimentisphaerales bacterium]|nr:endo-1,4-beta-xylanase [Sedimentisphaerales bacterium]